MVGPLSFVTPVLFRIMYFPPRCEVRFDPSFSFSNYFNCHCTRGPLDAQVLEMTLHDTLFSGHRQKVDVFSVVFEINTSGGGGCVCGRCGCGVVSAVVFQSPDPGLTWSLKFACGLETRQRKSGGWGGRVFRPSIESILELCLGGGAEAKTECIGLSMYLEFHRTHTSDNRAVDQEQAAGEAVERVRSEGVGSEESVHLCEGILFPRGVPLVMHFFDTKISTDKPYI